MSDPPAPPAPSQVVTTSRIVFLGMTMPEIRELVSHAGLMVLGAWCLANLLLGRAHV